MFLHPLILWALPLAALPVIIYYLMRFRSLRVDWGATYVLELALARLKRRLYLDQIILLALRVLACAGLVVAFARPVARAASRRLSGGGVHRVVILDVSYSLLADAGGRTLWEEQIELLAQLLATWGRGERWSLVLAAEAPEWLVQDAAMTSTDHALAILAAVRPRECAANLPRALDEAVRRTQGQPLELYLFSDRQATNWTPTAAFHPAGPLNRFLWVAPAAVSDRNLAITRLQPRFDRPLAGHPCGVAVSVRNFGAEPVADARVELQLDGAHLARESLSLLPGQEAVLTFNPAFADAGDHYLTARVENDVLAYDNLAHAGIEVADTIRLAVCRDPARTGKFDGAAPFLDVFARALAADDDAGPGLAALELREINLEEAGSTSTAAADVIIVDGGTQVSQRAAAELQRALDAGRTVLFSVDDQADLAAWNRHFPAPDLLPVGLARREQRPLGGEAFAATGERLRFYSWAVPDPVEPPAAVLLPFADGTPLAIVRPHHPGAALLLSGGLNGLTNNLLVSDQFFTVFFKLLGHASSARIPPRTLRRGEPLVLHLSAPHTVRGLTYAVNDGPMTAVPPAATVTIPAAGAGSGLVSVLMVRPEGNRRLWAGVQGERLDSDIKPLAPNEIEQLARRLGATRVASRAELEQALKDSHHGRERQPWVLAATVLLLVAELLMELRFI